MDVAAYNLLVVKIMFYFMEKAKPQPRLIPVNVDDPL